MGLVFGTTPLTVSQKIDISAHRANLPRVACCPAVARNAFHFPPNAIIVTKLDFPIVVGCYSNFLLSANILHHALSSAFCMHAQVDDVTQRHAALGAKTQLL